MSVSAPELISQRATVDGATNERTYVRVYRASASTAPSSDTEAAVYAALQGIGVDFGTAYGAVDTGALCREIQFSISRDNRRNLPAPRWDWDVTATWGSRADKSGQSPSGDKNPVNRLPKISVKTQPYSGVAYRGQYKTGIPFIPVENTAGDPVRREKRRGRMVISIEKNFASFDALFALEPPTGWLFSRNDSQWNGFGIYQTLFGGGAVAAGQGLLTSLATENVFENGVNYVKVNAEVLVDPDQHRDRFWSEGYRGYKNAAHLASGQPPSELFDPISKMRLTKPAYLDQNGIQIAPPAAPHEIYYQYYPAKNWGVLNLP